MTLKVELVVPDRELWAGEARTVIAKTTEGDIGILTGHAPVFGILAEGSLVEILPPNEAEENYHVLAAVRGGFLSVADDLVSILAAEAVLGDEVNAGQVRQDLDAVTSESAASGEESPEAKYARAQLRAVGEQA